MNTAKILNFKKKQVYIEKKQVYGNTVYYPACEESKIFSYIAETKTLTPNTLNRIKELGYTIELKAPSLDI